jgi:hypothetical protein
MAGLRPRARPPGRPTGHRPARRRQRRPRHAGLPRNVDCVYGAADPEIVTQLDVSDSSGNPVASFEHDEPVKQAGASRRRDPDRGYSGRRTSQGVLDGAGKTVRLDRMFLFVPLDLAKSLP